MKIMMSLFLIMVLACGAMADETYVVQEGDTLFRIAKVYKVSLEQLLKVNNLTMDSVIDLDQVITIPGVKAKVKPKASAVNLSSPKGITIGTVNLRVVLNNDGDYELIVTQRDELAGISKKCHDWHKERDDNPAKTAITDPHGPSSGKLRIHRGGSAYEDALRSRSASLGWFIPSPTFFCPGFRVVLATPI